MTRSWNRSPHEPTPELLAAYFDGELTGQARATVETWLADNPDARAVPFADLDDDLARAWRLTQPADPVPDAWVGVLDRIGTVAPKPTGEPLRRRPTAWKFLGAAAAAAALIGVVALGRTLWPTPVKSRELTHRFPQPKQSPLDPEEEEDQTKAPFAVAANSDVRVISMEGSDTQVEVYGHMVKSLVVGEPPVDDEVLLPTSYERTRLVGWVDPALRFDEWSVPIIVDPDVPTSNRQP